MREKSKLPILMKKHIFYLLLIWIFAANTFMHNAAFAQSESSHETIAPSAKNATEVLQRLLALIDNLHQPQDLTPERVAQSTRQPMIRINTPADFYYRSSHDLNERWWYYYIWSLNDATHLPGLGFAFKKTEKYRNQNIPMTDVCQFDVAQFHDALLRLGYEHVSSVRQESRARQYQRGAVEVEVGIVGESGESLEKISHDCIKRVSIGFLTRYLNRGGQQ